MKKIIFILLLTSCSGINFAQNYLGGFEPYSNSISVTQNNKVCQLAFAGGMDAPQFSACDLDFDGKKDLVIFDREGGKITCLLNKGLPGQSNYEYAPLLSDKFPKKLTDWMLMVDYNADGKEDIYTANPGGVRIFKNTSTISSGISFELVNPDVLADYSTFITRLYAGPADIPAILDVDGDGDIDILTMELGIDTAGDAVYWYKNLSIEKYGVVDSFDYVVQKRCWGRFRESFQNCNISLNYGSGPCGTGNKFIPDYGKEEFDARAQIYINNQRGGKHSGSTLLIFDSNGDGKKDILIGDIGCTNLYLLVNTADNINPLMTQLVSAYPPASPAIIENFPAAFLVDVNNDGKRDLIAVPNSSGNSDNFENFKLFLNQGSDNNPNFVFSTNSFLEEEMIEVGEGSNPVFVDFDQDGLQDILISTTGYYVSSGVYATGLTAYRNSGTFNQPAFTLESRDLWGMSVLNISKMVPTFGDTDNDGDLDMVTGSSDGLLHYFENTAGMNQPFNFIFRPNYFSSFDLGNLSTPVLVDINTDGKFEIISGERFDNINLLTDTSLTAIPQFKMVTDSLSKINMRLVAGFPSGRTTAIMKKLFDTDSQRLVISNANSKVYIFPASGLNPLEKNNIPVDSFLLHQGTYTSGNGGFGISMADIDGDEKPEIIAGTPQGGVVLFKNAIIPVGIQNNTKESLANIQAYPNPTANLLTIKSTINDKIININLFDIKGRKLKKWMPASSAVILDIAELEIGLYYFQVFTAKGIQTIKICKN